MWLLRSSVLPGRVSWVNYKLPPECKGLCSLFSCGQHPLFCCIIKDLLILTVLLLTTIAKLLGEIGIRSIVADSLLIKQQLLTSQRHQRGHHD
jgi:hypothetical protein